MARGNPQVQLHARAYQPGEVIVVVVDGVGETTQVSGRFLDKELSFFIASKDRRLALAPIGLETKIGRTTITVEGKTEAGTSVFGWTEEVQIQNKEFPKRSLTVNPKYVKLRKEDVERNRRDKKKLRKAFALQTSTGYLDGNFRSPVPGALSTVFGERRVFNGEPKSRHTGADLKGAAGTPITAPANGVVALTGNFFFEGKTVVLDHGHGVVSYYIHMSKIDVKEGDRVVTGQLLGKVGSTGRVTGPHLHWGLKIYRTAVDPTSLRSLDLDRWFRPSSGS